MLGLLDARGAICTAILVTHGHVDHVLSLADLRERTGAPVYAPEGERMFLLAPGSFSISGLDPRPCDADVWLTGGETVEAAGIAFAVRSVPGHSPAHLAYLVDGHLFSGDVLFAGSVGRTDFPGSDWNLLLESISSLVDGCPPDTIVYPGHGPTTTLGTELARNPFLAELRANRGHA